MGCTALCSFVEGYENYMHPEEDGHVTDYMIHYVIMELDGVSIERLAQTLWPSFGQVLL